MKDEEEEERKRKVEELRQTSLERARELYGSKKKRKKRRMRRTARTSSRSLRGRARRRPRQRHARFAGFPGGVPLRAVFPSVVVRPDMLGIMAVLDQKDIVALLVDVCGVAEVFSHGPDCPSQGDRVPCAGRPHSCRDAETGDSTVAAH